MLPASSVSLISAFTFVSITPAFVVDHETTCDYTCGVEKPGEHGREGGGRGKSTCVKHSLQWRKRNVFLMTIKCDTPHTNFLLERYNSVPHLHIFLLKLD